MKAYEFTEEEALIWVKTKDPRIAQMAAADWYEFDHPRKQEFCARFAAVTRVKMGLREADYDGDASCA